MTYSHTEIIPLWYDDNELCRKKSSIGEKHAVHWGITRRNRQYKTWSNDDALPRPYWLSIYTTLLFLSLLRHITFVNWLPWWVLIALNFRSQSPSNSSLSVTTNLSSAESTSLVKQTSLLLSCFLSSDYITKHPAQRPWQSIRFWSVWIGLIVSDTRILKILAIST